MSYPGMPTIDQLNVFLTVVDVGSFAGAARKLNRATSVISYTINNLEAQLGVALFDRRCTRRSQVTSEGHSLLNEVRTVSLGIDRLRAKARGLRQGLECEVTIAIDAMAPPRALVDALDGFAARFPGVPLRMRVEAGPVAARLLVEGTVQLGIVGAAEASTFGLECVELDTIALVAVAAPRLGLHEPQQQRQQTPVQVALDHEVVTQSVPGEPSPSLWRVPDLQTKHALVVGGLAWGVMPEVLVRDDLASGRLRRLAKKQVGEPHYSLFLAHRVDSPPGPATTYLMGALRTPVEANVPDQRLRMVSV